MKVLLTGSSGRIGSAVAALLSATYSLSSIDLVGGPYTSVVGDFGDAETVKPLLEKANIVIHCAALHAPHVSRYPDSVFQQVNVEATERLARLAKQAGVTRMVFTSTTALYGSASSASNSAVWIDESITPEPRTIYHRSKLAAEQALRAEANQDFSVVCLQVSRCFPESAPLMALYRLHRGVGLMDAAHAHRRALSASLPDFSTLIISAATPFLKSDLIQLKTDPPGVVRLRCPELYREFKRRRWSMTDSIDRVYDSAAAQKQLDWIPQQNFGSVLSLYDAGSPEVLTGKA